MSGWDFPGGPVVKNPHSKAADVGLIPSQETKGFPRWLSGKDFACQCRSHRCRSLGQEDPLEEEIATHSSRPTRKIPRTEEPGGLQSMGLQRVGHD